MATQSVVFVEKPVKHIGLADWISRNNQNRCVSNVRQHDAFALRHSARSLRNESDIQANWDTYHTNVRLNDRIDEVSHWREIMENLLERLEREILLLRDEKSQTERELEALSLPLSVVSECLSTRDSKLEPELTYDEAGNELKTELCVVENNQKILREQCKVAWEKLNSLNDVKFKMNLEICNKKEAEGIDQNQLKLDKFSSGITSKTDPLRIPANSTTHEGWLEYTKNLKNLTENELADTYAMRESLFVSREKAKNILHSQQDRTDHTLRRRIYETQRARNEIEWQLIKIKQEMERCLNEIAELEKALRDKYEILRLAETRQENRAQRSGMELCCDNPYKGLCDEIIQLRQTMTVLTDKINKCKTCYNALEDQVNRLETDLQNKEHALMTEIQTLDKRMPLKSWQSQQCKSQTERNIQLTRVDAEIPPAMYS